MNVIKTFGLTLLLAAAPALADENAAAALAGILADMSHFPSEEQKAELAEISSRDEVDEDLRTIADAIAGIEHQASDSAEAELQAIVDDPEAGEAEKTLAAAVIRFHHQPAEEDAAALQAMAQ